MKTAVLVGCGAMSDGWLSALAEVPELASGIRLAGLVDLDLQAAKARADKHNLDVPTGTDLAAMLAAQAPDLVFDLVVPAARALVVKTALSHGAHVLSEKPMANTMQEARELIEAARAANRLHAVIQNRRFLPGIRRIKQALAQGVIGELTAVHVDFFVGAHFGGFREQMDHVLLLDMAIHTFDAARWIIDRPATGVFAREMNPQGSWYKHGASADALFDFQGGVTLTYRGSWCAEGANTAWESTWRIIGTEGTILWDGNEGISAHKVAGAEGFFRPLAEVAIPPAPPMVQGHAGVILDFLRAVQARGTPLTEGADNIRSLAMVFAAIDSADKRTPVTI